MGSAAALAPTRVLALAPTAAFFVPAPTVPVSAQIRRLGRNDDQVPHTDLDDAFAAWTQIALARLIRLDRLHEFRSEWCVGIVDLGE